MKETIFCRLVSFIFPDECLCIYKPKFLNSLNFLLAKFYKLLNLYYKKSRVSQPLGPSVTVALQSLKFYIW